MAFLPPVHFSVSQLRVAAACPRIFYFDSQHNLNPAQRVRRVTRIWEQGSAQASAGGSLFHSSVEKFNRLAGTQSEVRSLLENSQSREEIFRGVMAFLKHECLNQRLLRSKDAEVIANLSHCVEVYMGELADIVHHALAREIDVEEIVQQLFADMPKRVDVTFHFGEDRSPVHLTGRLDYVFHDWRSSNLRIVDYKLAPAQNPHKDRFQISVYALMYHHQHGYACDATVFYLHPTRQLEELSWPQIDQERDGVYRLLASMNEWAKYDPMDRSEPAGLLPPGDMTYCDVCRWRTRCEKTLGPKDRGDFVALEPVLHNPRVQSQKPAPSCDELADEIAARGEERDERVRVWEDELVDAGEKHALQQGPAEPLHEYPVSASNDRLTIGAYVSALDRVEIPYQHLSTHTAVVGAAGSGKTWAAKVMAEEAVLCGVPVIAIDPQGDLVQFIESADESTIPHQWLTRFRKFHANCEARIFTPGTSHAIRLSLNPIRLPRREEFDSAMSSERREEEYIGMVEAVAVNIVGLVAGGKKSQEQQHSFVKKVLLRLLDTDSNPTFDLKDIARAVHDPESIGIDEVYSQAFIKKSDRENLARDINAIATGPLSKLFTGGLSLDISQMRTASTAGRVPLNIIYLNALTELEKHAFLAALATEIYRWMCCTGGSADRPQLLFYLDEARDFLPAGSSKPAAKMPLTRLFTQGRKFGVACLVCTQSPRSVEYSVFGNCSSKLIGRIETPQDSERVAEWFTIAGPKPAWLASRLGADRGTFIGRWPEQLLDDVGRVWTTRPLFTQHVGAWTPEQVESIVASDPVHQSLRRQLERK